MTRKDSHVSRYEEELIWFLREADGDACGLLGTNWSHLAEVDENARRHGSSSSRHAVQWRDPFPDEAEHSRRRLREAYLAWCTLSHQAQSLLEARYTARGTHTPTVPGLGEWTWVAQLLASVRRTAEATRRTPFAVLRELSNQKGAPGVLLECQRLCADALAEYVDARRAADAERTADRARRAARFEALRQGAR